MTGAAQYDYSDILYYRGKPIEEYSKEEIIILVRQLMSQLDMAHAATRSLLDLARMRERQ